MNIACGHCQGTGHVPMPASYAETLALLGRMWISTIEVVLRHAGPSHTALCNRLAWLHRNGYVERRGSSGRTGYEWRRK